MESVRSPTFSVRLARKDELSLLPALERSAGQRFKSIPALSCLAEDEPMSVAELSNILDGTAGLTGIGAGVWIVVDGSSSRCLESSLAASSEKQACQILGFLAAVLKDDIYLHVVEMSVALEHQGKGVGSMLLRHVVSLADASIVNQDLPLKGISLTTYPDLQFNGWFYSKHGFVEIEAQKLGAEHAERLRLEKVELRLEKDGWRRACMIRWVKQVK